MKHGQQVTEVGVSPLPRKNTLSEEARLWSAGFFVSGRLTDLPRAPRKDSDLRRCWQIPIIMPPRIEADLHPSIHIGRAKQESHQANGPTEPELCEPRIRSHVNPIAWKPSDQLGSLSAADLAQSAIPKWGGGIIRPGFYDSRIGGLSACGKPKSPRNREF
jgi:hypothetical protein